MKIPYGLLSILLINHAIRGSSYSTDLHAYIWANYNQFGGNIRHAEQWYTQLIKKNSSIYHYKGFIHFLHHTNNFKEIVALRKKIGSTFDNDPELQLIIIESLRRTGNHNDADRLTIQLAQQYNTNLEVVFEAAKVYIAKKELSNAKDLITYFLNSAPKKAPNCILYFLKAQIHIQLNDYNAALKDLKESVTLNPHFDKAWLLSAIIKEQQGNVDEAISNYTRYLKNNPVNDPIIQKHVISLNLKQQNNTHKETINHTSPSLYQKATLLFEKKQYKNALIYVDACLKKEPFYKDAQLLKLQLLYINKAYPQMLASIETWLNQNPYDPSLITILYHLTTTDAQKNTIIAMLEKQHKNNPTNELIILYLADIYTRTNHIVPAIAYLKKAYAITTNKELQTAINFQLALLHYKKGDYQAMIPHATACTPHSPYCAAAHNLLAYHYACNTKNLSDAEKHCILALKTEPENPHFIDTQALIHYKKQEYHIAETLLKKAITKAPNDHLVALHLAKTYKKLGNHNDAKQMLHTALTLAKNHPEETYIQSLITTWNKN